MRARAAIALFALALAGCGGSGSHKPSIVLYNDQSHLPEVLRWTGFPPELRP